MTDQKQRKWKLFEKTGLIKDFLSYHMEADEYDLFKGAKHEGRGKWDYSPRDRLERK